MATDPTSYECRGSRLRRWKCPRVPGRGEGLCKLPGGSWGVEEVPYLKRLGGVSPCIVMAKNDVGECGEGEARDETHRGEDRAVGGSGEWN